MSQTHLLAYVRAARAYLHTASVESDDDLHPGVTAAMNALGDVLALAPSESACYAVLRRIVEAHDATEATDDQAALDAIEPRDAAIDDARRLLAVGLGAPLTAEERARSRAADAACYACGRPRASDPHENERRDERNTFTTCASGEGIECMRVKRARETLAHAGIVTLAEHAGIAAERDAAIAELRKLTEAVLAAVGAVQS